MLTCIIENYREAFRKRKSDGKRMFKENITYEYLCDLFEIPCTKDTISCSIQTALKFFKEHRIGLKVYDIYMNIEEFIPQNFSRVVPKVGHLITYNKHVYTLNDNLKELYQKSDKAGTDMLSNQYSIINEFNTDYRLCESLYYYL